MTSIAALVASADRGDLGAPEALFAALYADLRRLAQRELAGHGGAISLGAGTLLHEAYLDMAARDGASFPDRARFMGYAARVMRGLIIEHARSRRAQKRGGQFEITALGTEVSELSEYRANPGELTRISDALDELAKADASLAQIVDLKFFCGFSFEEIAAMRGVSERTIQRGWEKARIYLHRALRTSAWES